MVDHPENFFSVFVDSAGFSSEAMASSDIAPSEDVAPSEDGGGGGVFASCVVPFVSSMRGIITDTPLGYVNLN